MKNSKVQIAERHKKAMQALCRDFDVQDAATRAGSNEVEVRQVFTELCKKPFSSSLEVFDVNKPFLAKKCQELLSDEDTKPADKIALMKLLLKTMGETVEDQSTTVNVNAPKALVMVGTTRRKIDNMLNPQLEAPSA